MAEEINPKEQFYAQYEGKKQKYVNLWCIKQYVQVKNIYKRFLQRLELFYNIYRGYNQV